jgi:cell division protein FtsW
MASGEGIRPKWQRRPERGIQGVFRGRELSVDKLLLVIILALTVFGLVMVYSASAMLAQKQHAGDQFYFLKRQAIWGLIGLVMMTVAIKVDYRYYKHRKVVMTMLGISLVLLVLVLFLPILNGTHRWIRYGSASLQPSEIAKLSVIIFLAYFIDRQSDALNDYKNTFVPIALISGVVMGLVAAEPDLGTALSIGLVFAVVVFAAGMPFRYLASLAAPAVPVLVYMLVLVPWRHQRILDFLDPWKNQTTSAFQTVQALVAIGSGGETGVGLAQGKQKLFYLPSPHTDFIFAVIGEELGLIGAAAVVLVFAIVAWRGLRAARLAPDSFGQLLAVGITVMIAAQAFFNMSVALSLVPAKGIPLPFISCGGSSLAMNLLAAGILLNVSKHGGESWH